jgi:hypothetical protein
MKDDEDKHLEIVKKSLLLFLSWTTFFYERSRDDESIEPLIAFNNSVDHCLSSMLCSVASSGFLRAQVGVEAPESMDTICSPYFNDVAANDYRARVLVCLLDIMASDAERATPLIGQCMQTFYSASPVGILVCIFSSRWDAVDEKNECYPEGFEAFSCDEITSTVCAVSPDAKASALYTLSVYLRYMFGDKKYFFSDIISVLPGLITVWDLITNPYALLH